MKNYYLGIIPARGGSKRVPRKNIRDVAGKPLIHYSIKAAQASKRLNDFIFSSEDEEILDIASAYADINNIIKRPSVLAGDEVRNTETILHAIDIYHKKKEVKVTHAVLLQPTSPFRTGEDIDNAIEKFEQSQCDTLASVSPAIKKRDNILKRKVDDIHCCDLIKSETPYEFISYNAAIYIVKYEKLFNTNLFKEDLQVFYEMSELNSIDVDTELDLKIADALMKNEI